MKTEEEIQELADKASDECHKPTKNRRGMSYEEGVRNALDWVLESEDQETPL